MQTLEALAQDQKLDRRRIQQRHPKGCLQRRRTGCDAQAGAREVQVPKLAGNPAACAA